MSNPPTPQTQCVTRTFDEFEDTTTITHNKTIGCGTESYKDGVHNTYQFQLRQIETKDSSTLFLVCTVRTRNEHYAPQGDMTFNCDQVNTHLPYRETRTTIDATHSVEEGYYELSAEILEAICSCSQLKIRIARSNGNDEPNADWCKNFQIYCRQFYNNAIDPTKFEESLSLQVRETGEVGCFSAFLGMLSIITILFGIGAIIFFSVANKL